MELQEIEVTIGKDGQVELTVKGVKGKKCLEITSTLEETLGGEILLREFTPEAAEDVNSVIEKRDSIKTGK